MRDAFSFDSRSTAMRDDTVVPFSRGAARTLAKSSTVSVVVPTLNEAANLPHVLPHVAPEYEVVIVDGGSEDGTIDVALALRPDAVVVHQTGRGKGDALSRGFAAANGDIIVML